MRQSDAHIEQENIQSGKMPEVSGSSIYVSSHPNEKGNKPASTSTMIKDPESAFGWSRYTLRLIGLWPYQDCNKSYQRLLMRYGPPVFSIWFLVFDMIAQVLAPFAYTFDRDEMITLIGTEAGLIGAIVRITVFWSNSKAMCLAFLSENWTRHLSTVDHETMMRNTKLVRNISIGVTLLVQCFYWSYVIHRAVPLLYLDLDDQNATELGKQLFYPAYCPLDLRDWTNFAIVWGGQCIGLLWGTFAYQGVDGFVAMLIIHLCGQITILRFALINLIDSDNSLSHANFQVKLRVLVRRHNALINFANLVKDTLNLLLLFFILSYTLQICCQLFQLMETVTERRPGQFPFVEVIFCISYLNATFIHLFLYCYIGDMLIQESEALGLASYSCKWYNLSGRSANDLKIVMCQARVPLQIWAGKFTPFSLPLFSNILKTAMSYFSVLLTMKN